MNFDASINMQIVARDKAVVLLFSRDMDDGAPVPAMTDNMRLDPETALVAAQAMTDMAFEADSSIKPIGPALKASMIEKHRSVLIPRISMMLNNLREKKTITNEQLAIQIMDRFCAEVFS
jgi:hypothetical protein